MIQITDEYKIQEGTAQRKKVDECLVILKKHNLVYLAAEVRTRKTIMSITTAHEIGWRKVLFVTTKKAIQSIKGDYAKSGCNFSLFDITNYEQLLSGDKYFPIYDGFIFDEVTVLGGFPKPGKIAKKVKELAKKSPMILMSGSPSPESFSQLFHQLWVSYYSPFSIYKNFYDFAKENVTITKKYFNGFQFSDYSKGKEKEIMEVVRHYMVTLSQEEAGFTSHVQEQIFWVDIDKRMYQLMNILKKDKVYKLKSGGHILCDTPVKLQSAFHQLSSGTIITDEGKREIFDESKAWFIKQKFAGQKIAVFYQFVSEGDLLRKIFPLNTDVPEIFNSRDDVTFVCQFVAGRMGVNLSTANWLVMYNIAFSATTYFQVRARMQSQTRTEASRLAWIFSKEGIEKYVYDAVCRKRPFTTSYFQKVYHIK